MNVKVKMKITIKGETFPKATVKGQISLIKSEGQRQVQLHFRLLHAVLASPKGRWKEEERSLVVGAHPGSDYTQLKSSLKVRVHSGSEFTQGQTTLKRCQLKSSLKDTVHSGSEFT